MAVGFVVAGCRTETKEEGMAEGLFRVIVEEKGKQRKYVLTPVTSRQMPLAIVRDSNRAATLADLASLITALPSDSKVYAAPSSEFQQRQGWDIRSLNADEIRQLHRILSERKCSTRIVSQNPSEQ